MKRIIFYFCLSVCMLTACGQAKKSAASALTPAPADTCYSVVILGDTHFDAEPATVYHSDYNEPVEWLNRVQRAEFARNGEMWRERCPRLVKRAVALVDKDTKFVYQSGDLIQGDCGNPAVHQKMLADVMDYFKGEFGGLPFVTVEGNHDFRGTGALDAYNAYMPKRMSAELGQEITKTTFSFRVGPDVFIAIDFSHPDDAEIEKLLQESEGARYTFVLCHSSLFPSDAATCRWFFHGADKEKHTKARRHFRELFAKRNVIALCGHDHSTQFLDWEGDGGRITQLIVNSVWSSEKSARYEVESCGAADFGEKRKAIKTKANGKPVEDESELFAEYRSGIRAYTRAWSAGSYKMKVSPSKVTVDFYAGDSQDVTETFILYDAQADGFDPLFTEQVPGGLNLIQGHAVFGDKLFQMHDHNPYLSVYDLASGRLLDKVQLDTVKTWHNNNVNFSNVYYQPEDRYPLLYAGQENIAEHKANVWRITEDASGRFSAAIVQTLVFPEPLQMGVYYPNIVLDNEAGKIYLGGFSRKSWKYGSDGNGVQLLRFPLPALSDGERVEFTTRDIEERFCNDFHVATQGAVIRKGKMYQVFGVPKYGRTQLVCTDLATGKTIFVKKLEGVVGEPEGLDFWQDRLIVSTYEGVVYASRRQFVD